LFRETQPTHEAPGAAVPRCALDFAEARAEKQFRVFTLPSQLYAQWRARYRTALELQDAREGSPNERLLQQIWSHQRLRRSQLQTLDGQTVTVLHPGFWNREAGPDFRRAVLQFGDNPPRSGDVEIDLVPSAWRSHGHDRNAAYRGVILHVVWDADPTAACSLPTLSLRASLDAPLEELENWLSAGAEVPAALRGLCSLPFCKLPEPLRSELLRQAALVRLRRKGGELEARARQVGWEQALWEGLFAALGYRRNVWPMRRLAELLPRVAPGPPNPSAVLVEARLLGIAGLLPVGPGRTAARLDEHGRCLWDVWWRERAAFADVLLPRGMWTFGGLRPANQPQRRLALAARWLSQGPPSLAERLEAWFRAQVADRGLSRSLLEALDVGEDPFWCRHWTLGSPHLAEPQPLLGQPRATDLAMNVILPWFWVRAHTGGNESLQHRAEQRYFAWPSSQDNVVLRLARQRLSGSGAPHRPPTAAQQQGLLQIVRDFCDRTNALCDGCRFPDLLRTLNG
jgi:hypothetical protein